jgi:hypothetical protein
MLQVLRGGLLTHTLETAVFALECIWHLERAYFLKYLSINVLFILDDPGLDALHNLFALQLEMQILAQYFFPMTEPIEEEVKSGLN